jgi:hypothetical protein
VYVHFQAFCAGYLGVTVVEHLVEELVEEDEVLADGLL